MQACLVIVGCGLMSSVRSFRFVLLYDFTISVSMSNISVTVEDREEMQSCCRTLNVSNIQER